MQSICHHGDTSYHVMFPEFKLQRLFSVFKGEYTLFLKIKKQVNPHRLPEWEVAEKSSYRSLFLPLFF